QYLNLAALIAFDVCHLKVEENLPHYKCISLLTKMDSTLMQTLRSLEDKLEDLRRDTRFCFNNYDYHHKNNEYEIMDNLQDILNESLQDGEEFLNRMKNVRSSITTARKTCSELDDLLLKVGINPDTSNTAAAINATGLHSTWQLLF
ncbi:hypothetical protein DOY81_002453, partial [Sarcophaga bullata]